MDKARKVRWVGVGEEGARSNRSLVSYEKFSQATWLPHGMWRWLSRAGEGLFLASLLAQGFLTPFTHASTYSLHEYIDLSSNTHALP